MTPYDSLLNFVLQTHFTKSRLPYQLIEVRENAFLFEHQYLRLEIPKKLLLRFISAEKHNVVKAIARSFKYLEKKEKKEKKTHVVLLGVD